MKLFVEKTTKMLYPKKKEEPEPEVVEKDETIVENEIVQEENTQNESNSKEEIGSSEIHNASKDSDTIKEPNNDIIKKLDNEAQNGDLPPSINKDIEEPATTSTVVQE